jgi:hypothetical protein
MTCRLSLFSLLKKGNRHTMAPPRPSITKISIRTKVEGMKAGVAAAIATAAQPSKRAAILVTPPSSLTFLPNYTTVR